MDESSLPATMIFSGFLPTGSLLDSLVHISNEVASMEKFPLVFHRALLCDQKSEAFDPRLPRKQLTLESHIVGVYFQSILCACKGDGKGFRYSSSELAQRHSRYKRTSGTSAQVYIRIYI